MESPHTKFEILADLVGGKLSEEASKEVLAHLATCSSCAISKMKLEKTLDLMRSDMLEDIPPHIFERTLDLFGSHTPATQERESVLNRIYAVLESVTSDFAPVFGLRSGQPEVIEKFVYTAEGRTAELRAVRSGDNWNVFGELISNTIANEAVLSNDNASYSSIVGDLGEFSFSGVAAGSYALVITFDDLEVVFSGIELR